MAGHGPVDESPSVFEDDEFVSGRSAVRIASVAALGGLLFGYDTAVINGANDAMQKAFGASNFMLGVAVASALIGAAIGALTAGRIADRVGRIAVMKLAAGLFLISAIGAGLAPDVW
ncbi:MAG TPA: MFS transporter, partial [Mycobacterium sp.]|nr:MFS transporter [Mycobacterium sp.]